MTSCALHQTKEPEPITPKLEVPINEKKRTLPIQRILTTDKKMALTFNGLADEKTMELLISELNRLQIKATFFLQGQRVAEEPELALRLIKHGHTVQNNTLNHTLPDELDYDSAYVELKLSNNVFQEHLNIEPSYVRSRSGDTTNEFGDAAAQLDMRVVTYTINPRDSQMQSAEEIAEYIKRFTARGSIIQLNTYINPAIIDAIELIYNDATAAGYKLTTLEEVESGNYMVSGKLESNNLEINQEIESVQPNIIKRFVTNEKKIALTFDDWASEATLSTILAILDEHHIKSTFFLIGQRAEVNPQLARLIIERGHEVASHSYNHKVVNDMGIDDLQEDLVLNDKVLTNALQEKPLNYFRPAQGLINEQSAKAVTATGIEHIILYDVASLDWDLTRPAEEVINRVISQTKPGSIIGMHILDESHTVEILPTIIEHFQKEGYSFRKISDMIQESK